MHQNALDITSKLSSAGLSRESLWLLIAFRVVCSFFALVVLIVFLFLPLFKRGGSRCSKALHDGVRLLTTGIDIYSIALHLEKVVYSGIRHLWMLGKHSWTLLHYNRLVRFVLASVLLWRERFDLLTALATPTSSLSSLLHSLLLVLLLLPGVSAVFVRLVSDSVLRVSFDTLCGFYTIGVSRRGSDLLLLGLGRLGRAWLRLVGHFAAGPSNDITSLLLFNMEELLLPGLVDSHDLLLQGS